MDVFHRCFSAMILSVLPDGINRMPMTINANVKEPIEAIGSVTTSLPAIFGKTGCPLQCVYT